MADPKNKFLFRILFAVVALGALTFLFFNENGILKFLKLKGELRQLDTEIRAAEDKLKTLQAEIDSLNTSKAKIERVAREKFNMMKKNETVLKIEEN
jgi:cell division protein FtsB